MAMSLAERERRYAFVRERMQQQDMDVLVVIGRDGANNRGNHRYLSGYGVVAAFHHYIVFPRVPVEPVFFSGESLAILTENARGWVRDIRSQLKPQKTVVEEVRRFKKNGGIGLVEMASVPIPIYLELVRDYGPDAVRDAAGIFKEARLAKSAEEIACCRKSAKLADDIYRHLKSIIRPGLSDYEIFALMSRMIHEGGCEYLSNLINCADTNALYAPIGNVLSKDGRLSVEITPAYEGYFTQLRADIPVSVYREPERKLLQAWEKAHAAALAQLKPGTRACDVYRAAADAAERAGYAPSGRAGHGIGLDVDEFVSLDPNDQTVLEPGMMLVVHIQLRDKDDHRLMNGGTYLVTQDGPEALSKVDLLGSAESCSESASRTGVR
jgi:Xaa-Pro aminopeptidase